MNDGFLVLLCGSIAHLAFFNQSPHQYIGTRGDTELLYTIKVNGIPI